MLLHEELYEMTCKRRFLSHERHLSSANEANLTFARCELFPSSLMLARSKRRSLPIKKQVEKFDVQQLIDVFIFDDNRAIFARNLTFSW